MNMEERFGIGSSRTFSKCNLKYFTFSILILLVLQTHTYIPTLPILYPTLLPYILTASLPTAQLPQSDFYVPYAAVAPGGSHGSAVAPMPAEN